MRGVAWFGVLGPLEVRAEGCLVPVIGRQQRRVLAVLLLRANHVVSVDVLIDLVWPDRPPASARREIQNCVGRLRRTLTAGGIPSDVIETRPRGYLLRASAEELDSVAFTRDIAAADRVAASRPADAVALLRGALALWRGPPLTDIEDDFVDGEVRGLQESRLTALERCLELELKLGRHRQVADELAALVREHPSRERLWAQLMLALHRDGRNVEALAAFRRARSEFVAEFGVEPGPQLRDLNRAIAAGDRVVDLPGWGIERPEPRQLPADTADFTGRGVIVAELEKLLRTGQDGRAVVISAIAGKAGVGKTTLAVHVAHRLLDAFPDGQLYVNLRGGRAQRAEPVEVLARFLRALGVAGPAIPDGVEERAEMYRALLGDRRCLVVLDNAVDEAQVRPLIPGCAGCAVLITSRSRLAGLPGARLVELEVLESEQAVELLSRIAGARRVKAEIGAARDLARLCGCLPLALRITGARLVVRPDWTLVSMADRLADASARLAELRYGDLEVRASLSLSYQGLQPRSCRLFHLLGILDAADFAGWVCAALLDVPVTDVDDLIAALTDAQLLEIAGRDAAGHPRYRLHDLVRLYARECAEAAEPAADRIAATMRALGGWLALVARAHVAVTGGDFASLHGTTVRWTPAVDEVGPVIDHDPLAWYESERVNLVAGVRQAADAGLDELCWELALGGYALYLSRGHYDDWEDTLTWALTVTQRRGNRRGTAAALLGLGILSAYRRRYADASEQLDAALRLLREVGDPRGVSYAVGTAAHVDGMHGQYDRAITQHRQAIEMHRALGDRGAETLGLQSLGQLLLDIGRTEQARPVLEQAVALARQGDRRAYAEVLYSLGQLHLAADDVDRAEATLQQTLGISREIGDSRGEASALYGLGLVRLATGAPEAANVLLRQALTLKRRLGGSLATGRIRLALGELHRRRWELDQAANHLTAAVRIFAASQTPLWQARALNALGDLHAQRHDAPAAQDARACARVLLAKLSLAE